ncbi:LOW QUALITY PROTEIN: olfactory receptor 10H2-like [Spheniscus humboldti]
MRRDNQSTPRGFILTGFSHFPQRQVMLFVLFLLMPVVTLAGNMVIMVVIRVDRGLHTPLYLFLCALSFSELCCTSSISPKMLSGLAPGTRAISFLGCAAQMHFYFMFGFMHSFLLAVMGYDQYVSTCHPLCYNTLTTSRVFIQLVVASWGGGLLGLLVTCTVFQLPFCWSHQIDHFFCHMPPPHPPTPWLQLACASGEMVATMVNVLHMTALLGCFLLILLSYAFILGRILQIPSVEGRHKTFCTCASHIAVVVVHYGCASIIYPQCKSPHAAGASAVIDVSCAVFTPFLSPIIFSLSEDLKNVLWKSLRKIIIRNVSFWPGSK